jgi:NADH:ubiquinone reductase (H+-translocating)
MASDVVIVGGGFGGLYAARRLERRLPRHSVRILLVTEVNFLLYTPLLPGAAAGVKPAPVVERLGLPLNEHGRIEVDATMKVTGRENVWAIGDAAAVPDPARRRQVASPPTCQHAIRQGRRVAENMAATLQGRKPRPFRYRTLGVFVDMGQHKAVATVLGVRLRGLPAWFAARTYHLMMMPGVARKVRLGLDWGGEQ